MLVFLVGFYDCLASPPVLILPVVLSDTVRGPFWPTLALSSIAGDDCDSNITYETADGAQAAAGCIAQVAPQFLKYPALATRLKTSSGSRSAYSPFR